MKCLACGSTGKKYSAFSRMKSIEFKEDSRYLSYTPLPTKEERKRQRNLQSTLKFNQSDLKFNPSKLSQTDKKPPRTILIDQREYKLGFYFLQEDTEKNYARLPDYENAKGFFKKHIEEFRRSRPRSRKVLIKMYMKNKPREFELTMTKFEPPLKYRWACWYVLSTKTKTLDQDNYQRLVRSYKKEVEDIVRKDVPRTFSTNPFFLNKIEDVEVGREMLYKVCKAIGTYFPEVGYCQGLNFLVGFFLQVSGGNQMETINTIVSLMTDNRFMLIAIYDQSFPLVAFLKYAFHRKLRKIDSQLEEFLVESMLPDDVWLTKWFISLSTGYFPKYYSARILDYTLSQDIFGFLSCVLAVVVSLKGAIYGEEMDVLNDILNGLCSKKLDRVDGRVGHLPKPKKLIRMAQRFRISAKEAIGYLEDFDKDETVLYGREEFRKYLPHFKDYLLSKSSHDVQVKIFDFAAESVLPPESVVSRANNVSKYPPGSDRSHHSQLSSQRGPKIASKAFHYIKGPQGDTDTIEGLGLGPDPGVANRTRGTNLNRRSVGAVNFRSTNPNDILVEERGQQGIVVNDRKLRKSETRLSQKPVINYNQVGSVSRPVSHQGVLKPTNIYVNK